MADDEILLKKDPLAAFRRPGSAPLPPAPPVAEKPLPEETATEENYRSDEDSPTRFRLHSIELRPLKGLWSNPTYAHLIDVLPDGANPTFVALYFLHLLVIIRGRNLKTIVAGLRMRTQWMIEQNASPPENKNTPYVESMEFIAENVQAAYAALRQTMNPNGNEKTPLIAPPKIG